MAVLTEGYPFAVQVLGYICWNQTGISGDVDFENVIKQFDLFLEDYVYDKLWSDMSERDRQIITAIANNTDSNIKIKAIMESTGISSSLLSNYRKRLLGKGIVKATSYGKLALALPRFAEFVKRQYMFENLL